MKVMLTLPRYIFERNMPGLLRRLGDANDADEVYVDFKNVTYFTPGAIAAITAKVCRWHAQGKSLFFLNHKACAVVK